MFAGKEKEEWDEQWALYDADLGEFVIMYNSLGADAKELEGIEKHLRRAETLAMRTLEERGNTRSGRK